MHTKPHTMRRGVCLFVGEERQRMQIEMQWRRNGQHNWSQERAGSFPSGVTSIRTYYKRERGLFPFATSSIIQCRYPHHHLLLPRGATRRHHPVTSTDSGCRRRRHGTQRASRMVVSNPLDLHSSLSNGDLGRGKPNARLCQLPAHHLPVYEYMYAVNG
ncbi:hypothetical protein LY76DRAFT_14649 [Colletotrichum caudatum]|nr:hypothetical protein LY76DRAFT_14649 [Colletotrichum caudatum]